MKHIMTAIYSSPTGTLLLGSYKDRLCLCDWVNRHDRARIDRRIQRALKAEYIEVSSAVIIQAIEELDAYFRGELHRFGTSLIPIGTPFQQAVWSEIAKIPYGDTATYKEIAERIGKPKAIRAVATAVGANALSLFIPCHRIVGSDGALRGYAGGVEAKSMLLRLEFEALKNIIYANDDKVFSPKEHDL